MPAVPARGMMTLEACSAFTTSVGEKPFAARRGRVKIDIDLTLLAAKWAGVDRPGMVNKRIRMKFRL